MTRITIIFYPFQVWNDYKCRVRTKLAEISRGYRGTGGGPSRAPQLSPLEERVAALIGRDVGPLTGVRHDPEIEIEVIRYSCLFVVYY